MSKYIMRYDSNLDDYGYEVEKPRGKKNQLSKRQKTKKSNHKHQYEPVVFEYEYDNWSNKKFYQAGKRCTVCGKLSCGFPDSVAQTFNEWRKAENNGRYTFSLNEAKNFAELNNYPIIPIDDVFNLKEALA